MANHEENRATRREVLKAAGAVVAGPLVGIRAFGAPTATAAFLTPDEFAIVDELSELIIPADEHSPGARAAQVASFIDQQLHETLDDEARTRWRDGLKAIDAVAKQIHGSPFMQASPEQRMAVLERVAANEEKPEKVEEKFFIELKSRTAYAYYTSKIGIHGDLEYKGNTYQEEFAGYDPPPLKTE